ncbi:MAG: hypothetical protein U0L76_04100 [Ruminococcus sp.]|nr:hypothetical protein [Ruminococcus sp.]
MSVKSTYLPEMRVEALDPNRWVDMLVTATFLDHNVDMKFIVPNY